MSDREAASGQVNADGFTEFYEKMSAEGADGSAVSLAVCLDDNPPSHGLTPLPRRERRTMPEMTRQLPCPLTA